MELLIFLICLIIISVGVSFWYIYGYKPIKELHANLKRLTKELGHEYFEYTGRNRYSGYFSTTPNGELTLFKQDPRIAEFIALKAYSPNLHSTTPKTLVYTGATVGGITTGGFHTVGGETLSTAVKTSKIEMKFYDTSIADDKFLWELKPITRIYLGNNELRENAKKSKICDYLDENGYNIIVKEDNKVSAAAILLHQAGRQEASANQITLDSIASYPNMEKCKAIMDFICGFDNKKSKKH